MPVAFTSKAVAGSSLNNTIGAGSGIASLQTQNVTVTGNVYDYAVPNTLSTPIDLGNIHAGGTFTSQTVSVRNLAPVSDYSESLQATAGSWNTIVPGGSANLTVGISENTGGGQKTVSVPVAFVSNSSPPV